MTRRIVGLALGVLMTATGAARQPGPSLRPNILVIIADDWSYPHAGAYGDKVVKTPTFDRVAREGVLFRHAFVAAPSCTPSRASLLTGQAPHHWRRAATSGASCRPRSRSTPTCWSAPAIVGQTGKGWGPGNFEAGGRTRNPAGPQFGSFDAFLTQAPQGQAVLLLVRQPRTRTGRTSRAAARQRG